MANVVFTIPKELISTQQLNLSTASYGILLTSACQVNQEWNDLSQISAYEISDPSYQRKQLQNTSLQRDQVNHKMKLLADDVTWDLANFSADGAIIFVNGSIPLRYIDFGVPYRSQNTPFTITWNRSTGIISI